MSAFPVADAATTRRAMTALVRGERWALVGGLALTVAATAAGLAAPWLLGAIIDAVARGDTGVVDGLAVAVLGFAALRLVLTRLARRAAHRMGSAPRPGCGRGSSTGSWRCPAASWNARAPATW
ncbi:hypothetical protein ACFQV2_10715 [Actinokineospora soli]|uniref:ABC transmembrane type-1 domain-containing protein n=1 Tax=Actinokineospora soli TaxID=1048753 RepID=A0ABW2TKM8_9PSEU